MKKVAIIGQTLNKNYANKISGGIQTVERLHVDIFLSRGWEVHFIAPSDCEVFREDESFKIHLLSTGSEDAYSGTTLTKHQKGALNKSKSADILDAIQLTDPDLVINHSFSSSHVRLAADLSVKYPVLNFVHNTADTAMDIAFIAKLQHYLRMTKNGSNLVCVSGYQRDTWRVAINKRIDSGSEHFTFIQRGDINQVYDPYVYPVFVKPVLMSPQRDVTDRFIVITRPDPIKNLHKMLELMNAGTVEKFPLDIFIAHPTSLTDNDYYVSKVDPVMSNLVNLGWDIKIHHNAPRNDLLKALSAARGCFIPCPVEAAPVALLEAASYGVKSIVFGKKRDGVLGHAAVDLLGEDNIQLVDVSVPSAEASSSLQKAVKSIAADEDSRKKLHAYTHKMHSFSQRTSDIMSLADTVMSRYSKSAKPKLIEF